MKDIFVLDACAMIALLREENGSDVVESMFVKALEGNATILMNKLNLLEVYYDTFRLYNKETADELLDNVPNLPIQIITDLNDDVFKEAGRLKCTYKISLADSVALAEASISGGSLLTSDHHEFDVIDESEEIKVQWIR
jgi:predicted nucleic acid-binding protein